MSRHEHGNNASVSDFALGIATGFGAAVGAIGTTSAIGELSAQITHASLPFREALPDAVVSDVAGLTFGGLAYVIGRLRKH